MVYRVPSVVVSGVGGAQCWCILCSMLKYLVQSVVGVAGEKCWFSRGGLGEEMLHVWWVWCRGLTYLV